MTDELGYDETLPKRAFQKGMLLALCIAFLPLLFVGLILFISGYHPADINTGLRVAMIALWLAYAVTADKVADMRLWRRLPAQLSENASEVFTVVAFSALLSTIKMNPGMAREDIALAWIKSFGLFVVCFGMLYVLFKAYNAARRRIRYRRKIAAM